MLIVEMKVSYTATRRRVKRKRSWRQRLGFLADKVDSGHVLCFNHSYIFHVCRQSLVHGVLVKRSMHLLIAQRTSFQVIQIINS